MKTKKVILTFITDALPFFLLMIIGIFKSKVLIMSLSTNVVGLYQLYSSLLGYITIFEFGFSSALLYRLFKPIKEKDAVRVNKLFSMGIKTYKYVGLLMLIIGLGVSFFIPLLIKDNPFSLVYIIITFLLYIMTNIIYYLVVSYKILLDAKEKKYLTNIIFQSFEIVKSILEIVVLLAFKNLIILLIVGIITTSLSSLIIIYLCKKDNPQLKKVKYDKNEIVPDIKDLAVHKISWLVNNNIDLLIITKFLGLPTVVIYSAYHFICNALKRVLTKIYTSIVPSLGNILIEDINKGKKLVYEINHFVLFTGTLLSSSLLVAINPFIEMFYENKVNTNVLLAIAFSLLLYFSVLTIPYNSIVDAKGLFKSTKKCAIFEAIGNLTLSLILINYLGIFGIILATILCLLLSNIWKSIIIFKEVFNSSSLKINKETVLLTIIAFGYTIILYFLTKNIVYENLLFWLTINLGIFIFTFGILITIYRLLKFDDFINRFKSLIRKSSK